MLLHVSGVKQCSRTGGGLGGCSCGGVFSVAGVTGDMEVVRRQADVFPDISLSDHNVQEATQLCFLLTILTMRWVNQIIMGTSCSH